MGGGTRGPRVELWTIFALVKVHSKSDLNRRTICYCWTSLVSTSHFFFFIYIRINILAKSKSLRRVKITHFMTDFRIQMSVANIGQSIIFLSSDTQTVYTNTQNITTTHVFSETSLDVQDKILFRSNKMLN